MRSRFLAAVGVTAVLCGCGASSRSSSTASTSAPTASTSASTTSTGTTSTGTTAKATSASASAPVRQHHRRRPAPDPGSLPQTHELPSAHTATFRRQMRALWRGVRTNSLHAALTAFFPAAAYAQVKAISDPRADWSNRLVRTFGVDIAAAHALLSAGGARAILVRVDVPSGFAHWVDPGACYNRIGYYELPNARVVYRDAGAVRSFGIASMISWRGVWYVVHLGAVTGDASGTVDAPSEGPGTSTPSATC